MKALITGITGQDGSYLAELLIAKGYEVHGILRRTSNVARSGIRHLHTDRGIFGKRLFFHYAELDDPTNIRRILVRTDVDEVYHLASQSQSGISFDIPEITCDLTGMATLRLLEALRDLPRIPKLFHASSSEVFGKPATSPQNESTPIAPVTPYGCAKAFATHMVRTYRERFNMFAVNGILYNHESPRRGDNFVTGKICNAAASIKLGLTNELKLGDISAQRDWGHARDTVDAMWRSLQHEAPEDYVFATGNLHSVEDVLAIAFGHVGLSWNDYVGKDTSLIRKVEPGQLAGDASKAQRLLGWTPTVSFKSLIEEMTESALKKLGRAVEAASPSS